jgi:hypothetical protein
MAIPSSDITFSSIQTEFGGSNPIGLTEYYAGGLYVPALTEGDPAGDPVVGGSIPTTGQISIGYFSGAPYVPYPGYYLSTDHYSGMNNINSAGKISIDAYGYLYVNTSNNTGVATTQLGRTTRRSSGDTTYPNATAGPGNFTNTVTGEKSYPVFGVPVINLSDTSGTIYQTGKYTNNLSTYSDWFISQTNTTTLISTTKRIAALVTLDVGYPTCITHSDSATSERIWVAGTAEAGSATNGVIIQYDNTLAYQWTKRFPYGTSSWVSAIAHPKGSTSGDIYVLIGTGIYADQFLVKLDSLGVEQWQKNISTTGVGVSQIVVDSSGNSYITFINAFDNWLVKYNSSGVRQWSRILGQSVSAPIVDVTLNTSQTYVYVASANVIFKCNASDGTVVFKRTITSADGFSNKFNGVAASDTHIYLNGWHMLTDGITALPMLWNVPADGTKTGTYITSWPTPNITFTYASTASTDSSNNLTEGATTCGVVPGADIIDGNVGGFGAGISRDIETNRSYDTVALY